MGTTGKIIIAVTALAAIGGLTYFLINKSKAGATSATETTTTTSVTHGGVVSGLRGIFDGLSVSLVGK